MLRLTESVQKIDGFSNWQNVTTVNMCVSVCGCGHRGQQLFGVCAQAGALQRPQIPSHVCVYLCKVLKWFF